MIHLNVFHPLNVAPIVKSCDPEPTAHPILGTADALELIKPWLMIIGPALGLDPEILETVVSNNFADTNQIMESCS